MIKNIMCMCMRNINWKEKNGFKNRVVYIAIDEMTFLKTRKFINRIVCNVIIIKTLFLNVQL